MKKETLNMIGLAKRAGAVMSGSFLVEQALRRKKARLVLVAEDASENTKKQITALCQSRSVPLGVAGLKDELGHALGQGERSCMAIIEDHLADAVKKRLEEEGINWNCQGV